MNDVNYEQSFDYAWIIMGGNAPWKQRKALPVKRVGLVGMV